VRYGLFGPRNAALDMSPVIAFAPEDLIAFKPEDLIAFEPEDLN